MTHALFLDEAGNTGPHYCNAEQPVFVAAGFMLSGDRQHTCEEIVLKAKATLSARIGVQVDELKAGSLIGSGRGRVLLVDTLEALERSGAIPVVAALDKHFSLGARFVDDYLDPSVNPRGGPEFCTDTEAMRAAASIVSSLSLPTLERIQQGLRERTLEARRGAVRAVVEELRRIGPLTIADRIEGALIDLAGPMPDGSSEYSWPAAIDAETPNVASFSILLMNADALAETIGAEPVDVFHDEAGHLQPSLQHAYRLLSEEQAFQTVFGSPLTITPRQLVRLKPPIFACSQLTPLLQASDLLAGGTAYWLKRALARESFDPATRRLACLAMRTIRQADPRYMGIVFPDDTPFIHWTMEQLSPEQRALLRGEA